MVRWIRIFPIPINLWTKYLLAKSIALVSFVVTLASWGLVAVALTNHVALSALPAAKFSPKDTSLVLQESLLVAFVTLFHQLSVYVSSFGLAQPSYLMMAAYVRISAVTSISLLLKSAVCLVQLTWLGSAVRFQDYSMSWDFAEAMDQYKDNPDARAAVDWTQMNKKCCGLNGPEDWQEVPWTITNPQNW